MQYREKLIALIKSDNSEDVMNWVQQQPLIEQPDIIREFKIIMAELMEKAGLTKELQELEEFDKHTDAYEEAILNEQLESLKVDILQKETDKSKDEMFKTAEKLREYAIECIVTKADNAPQMWELAEHIIHFEKEAGTYDPNNWKAIL
jgi:hypothetical protein